MMLAKNKLHIFFWLGLLIISLLTYFALRNDASLYEQPIVSVEKVKIIDKNNSTDAYLNRVTNYQQAAQVKFLNTNRNGEKIWLENTYDSSQGMEQKLKPQMQIFLRKQGDIWSVDNVKRDATWIPLLVILIGLLINLMGRAGRLTALSLVLNSILFIIAIILNLKTGTHYLLPLFIVFSVIVSALTLGLVMGFKKRQTWVIFATVVTATCSAMLLAALVFKLNHNHGVNFELLGFITQLPMPMFFTMTLVGVLGAVMDESTDMIATLFALRKENPNVSTKELIDAGRHVGQEIFGALTNVLFLIFIAAQIPMAILFLRNGNNIGYTYDMNMALGMLQTLISAIGIVLTVPAGILWVIIDSKYEMRQRRLD